MLNSTGDLDAYCDRIGYVGDRSPTVATLGAVQEAHVRAIPFENLDSLAGQVVAIDLESVQDKLVGRARGGYCFEHNTLLWRMLENLGFTVSALAARVRWQVPAEMITPLGHMALRVDLDGESYLVDAGFGGLSLTTPLNLAVRGEQATAQESCRLTQTKGDLLLEAKLGDTWTAVYQFDLRAHYPRDFEVFNWYTCSSPQSPFVNSLMAARLEGRTRHTLLDNRYTVRNLGDAAETRMLASAEEVRCVLEEKIGVPVPSSPALMSKLGKIAASTVG